MVLKSQKLIPILQKFHYKDLFNRARLLLLILHYLINGFAVNGHQSFNAIIENGSFMRISRYYPTIGYQKDNEIQDKKQRSQFKLGKLGELKNLKLLKFQKGFYQSYDDDFHRKETNSHRNRRSCQKMVTGGRKYFKFKTDQIPFRLPFHQQNIRSKARTIKEFPSISFIIRNTLRM